VWRSHGGGSSSSQCINMAQSVAADRLTKHHVCCLPLLRLAWQPPDQLQLYKDQVVLEDAKKLADLKIENDDVVALCYAQAGALETQAQ
jgi:hypothetical protein